MRLLAEFDPPDALSALDAWKLRNADALAATPPDAVRIDVGRMEHPEGTTSVRVNVADEYAERFVT